MVIFKGQDDGTGASNDPIVYTGVTLTFTGTLRAFFQRKYLSDFTITSVEGTFVSQSATSAIAQTNIVGSLDTPLTTNYSVGSTTVTLTGGSPTTSATAAIVTGAGGGGVIITSVTINNVNAGYAVGDQLTIPATLGGSSQTLTLTLANMLPEYTTQVVNLKQVYMDAEDAIDTTGNLIFTVYNTLDHDLNYKYAFVTRIYNTL
jgi:hypothetical protein